MCWTEFRVGKVKWWGIRVPLGRISFSYTDLPLPRDTNNPDVVLYKFVSDPNHELDCLGFLEQRVWARLFEIQTV